MEGYKTTRSDNLITNMERVVGFFKNNKNNEQIWKYDLFLSTYRHATLPSYNSYHPIVATILHISSYVDLKKKP
jgi:hypothetical protein